METRRIKARNGEGLTFSVVGLGTGPLGDFYELLDEKPSIATVEQALASGVRVFDSSPHYGNGLAESRMGAGLRRAKRDEILVSTKIGRIMDPFTKPPEPRKRRGLARLRRRISARAALRLFLRRRDALDRAFSLAHGARPARHRSHSRLRRLDAWQGGGAGPLQGSDGRAPIARSTSFATRRSSRRSASASTKPTPASNSPRPAISTSR